MKEYVKILKDWYKLARPNKLWTILNFIAVVMNQVSILLAPIFSARATLDLTSGQYSSAIINLIIVFIIFLLRKTFWHFNYICYTKQVEHSYTLINNEFVDKALKAKLKNYKNTPKEKILNIVHSDVLQVSELADDLVCCAGRIVILIVTIGVIFNANIWAGIIVIVADILLYFILNFFQKRRSVYEKKVRIDHDYQFEKFSEIVDSRESIIDLGLEKKAKKEYNNIIDTYNKNYYKRTWWDSIIDNYFAVIYTFVILIATIILVVFVAGDSLSLETYFIIVSYITSGIEKTKDIFTVIPYIRTTGICVERVNTVLNFVERDEIEYGTNNIKDVLGSINFSHVCYKRDDEGNPSLKNFDVMFRENETHLILGLRECGKRTVFNLLRRSIKAEKGTIYYDGVNILDYNKNTYRDNFCYVTTKPAFFKGSIMKNLQISEKNKSYIFQTCKEVGVYDYIENLPKKFNTDVSSLPYEKRYLIALARAILTGAEVLVIYEFPQNLSEYERNSIKQILDRMHGTRTIIIFSAQEYCASIADKIVTMQGGEIKAIQFNQKEE